MELIVVLNDTVEAPVGTLAGMGGAVGTSVSAGDVLADVVEVVGILVGT